MALKIYKRLATESSASNVLIATVDDTVVTNPATGLTAETGYIYTFQREVTGRFYTPVELSATTLAAVATQAEWGPYGGTYFFGLNDATYAPGGGLESTIIPDTNEVKVYFTAQNGVDNDVISVMSAPTMDSTTWTINPTPIIGKGYGGAPADRVAHCSVVFKANGYYYCYAVNGYGNVVTGQDQSVYLYRSTDGYNFTDLGLSMPKSLIYGSLGYGNICVWPHLVDGKYHMICEVKNSNAIWVAYHATADNLEGPWSIQNSLSDLQVNGGMYGGTCFKYINGMWHIWYHLAVEGGNLPTVLGYAISSNFRDCTIVAAPYKGIEAQPFPVTDQIADPWVEEIGGKSYMLAEYVENTNPTKNQINLWSYAGPLVDLLSTATPQVRDYVTWTESGNMTISTDLRRATKTTGVAAGWNAGARGANLILDNTATTSVLYERLTAETFTVVFGLSDVYVAGGWNQIRYGVRVDGADSYIIENGTTKMVYSGRKEASWRIKFVTGAVEYYLNGKLEYTSLTAAVYPLFPVVAIYEAGGWIDNVRIN